LNRTRPFFSLPSDKDKKAVWPRKSSSLRVAKNVFNRLVQTLKNYLTEGSIVPDACGVNCDGEANNSFELTGATAIKLCIIYKIML